ncbi:hypothetical protein ACFX13_031823 [Malus domestica]
MEAKQEGVSWTMLRLMSPTNANFDLCYEWKPPLGFKDLPTLTFHFENAHLDVKPGDAFITFQVDQNVVLCLGFLEDKMEKVKTYVYDGLYLVEKCWQGMGSQGKLVFNFQLDRIQDQPELAWKEVKKSKKFKVREDLCANDISVGKESIPICAVNTIDDEKPPPFIYITSMIYPYWCRPIPPEGCSCIANAQNLRNVLVRLRTTELEIFKTESRGWGVRSLNSIPSGSFVCECIGELLEEKEAEERTGNDQYLFDIGNNYNDNSVWDGLSTLMPNAQSNSCGVVGDGGFTVMQYSAATWEDLSTIFCSPNLYAQNVLYDHDDTEIPHHMFFAAENIHPLQELTYHYNYMIDRPGSWL